MKKILLSLLVVLGVAGTLAVSQAQTSAMGLFGGEKSNYIKSGEIVEGSAFLAGNDITVEGTIKGDLYCAGQTVVITGTVDGDIICAAQKLTVGGHAHNLRLAGQDIRLSGEYTGSVSLVGQFVDAERTTRVAGDVAGVSQRANLAGDYGRDIALAAQQLVLTGNVSRDIQGEYEELRIAEGAMVGGRVTYISEKEAVVDGAVTGGVDRTTPTVHNSVNKRDKADGILMGVAMLGGMIILSLLLALILPLKMRTVTGLNNREKLIAIAIGLATLFVAPIVLVIVMLTLVGIPLALTALIVWVAILALSWPVAAYGLGRSLFESRGLSPLLWTASGALILAVLSFIPLINAIVVLGALAYGAGALVYSLRFEHRPVVLAETPKKSKK